MRYFHGSALLTLILSYFGWHYAESLTRPIVIVPDVLRFVKHHNAGIAFGITLPEHFQSLIINLALAAVLLLVVRSNRDRVRDIGFGLIFGGGLSNVIDRASDRIVTDFIAVGTFPVFNIPDTCITIGVILLILEGLRRGGLKE